MGACATADVDDVVEDTDVTEEPDRCRCKAPGGGGGRWDLGGRGALPPDGGGGGGAAGLPACC